MVAPPPIIPPDDSGDHGKSIGAGGGGGLTDAELRATPVPVSGTVTVTDGAGPLTIDGTVTATAQPGVDIGDVDILSVVPGTGATELGKAEDAVHASGDVGVMALAVRNDADAVRTSADGDYSPISTDSAGRVKTSPITKSDRKVDGKSLSGAGTIVIPDGVISFAITVNNKGTSTTVTGPDITSAWTLFSGQSVSHGADDVNEGSNLVNGPITVTTVGAAADVNASWIKP